MSIDYKSAGVDIAAGNEAVKRIKRDVESTYSSNVLTSLGGFGSLFDLKFLMTEYAHPLLVQSIDGVGTKMMVAKQLQKFDTIGIDLVSATTNDIIVLGAKPLTLLDYIANDKLYPDIIEQIIIGMAKACRENSISLVGGETAEMPGTYLPGEHDLVGVITGVVEKAKVILGKDIQAGDIVIGFPSSGLHTNGFSLARKLLFDVAKLTVHSKILELKNNLGEELLTPHLNYTNPILHLLANNIPIKGMAHITGGGLLENIPRILPANVSVEIKKNTWPALAIFDVLARLSQLDDKELYRTFNMGMGMILIVAPENLSAIIAAMQAYPEFPLYEIGQVVPSSSPAKTVRII